MKWTRRPAPGESGDFILGAETTPDIQKALFEVGVRHHLWSIGVNLAAVSGFALLTWRDYPAIFGWLAAALAITILRLTFICAICARPWPTRKSALRVSLRYVRATDWD